MNYFKAGSFFGAILVALFIHCQHSFAETNPDPSISGLKILQMPVPEVSRLYFSGKRIEFASISYTEKTKTLNVNGIVLGAHLKHDSSTNGRKVRVPDSIVDRFKNVPFVLENQKAVGDLNVAILNCIALEDSVIVQLRKGVYLLGKDPLLCASEVYREFSKLGIVDDIIVRKGFFYIKYFSKETFVSVPATVDVPNIISGQNKKEENLFWHIKSFLGYMGPKSGLMVVDSVGNHSIYWGDVAEKGIEQIEKSLAANSIVEDGPISPGILQGILANNQ